MMTARVWRRLGAATPIVLWCGVYLICRLVLAAGVGQSHPGQTSAMVIGTLLLGLLVWLALKVNEALWSFEDLIQSVPFVENSGTTRVLNRTSPEVELYMRQSRRSGRPLGMVLIKPEHDVDSSAIDRCLKELAAILARGVTDFKIANLIGGSLRRVDLLVKGMTGGFMVLCPDADVEKLNHLAERVRKAVDEELGVQVACGTAAFPDDALTLDVLAQKAEADLQQATNAQDVQSLGTERVQPMSAGSVEPIGQYER